MSRMIAVAMLLLMSGCGPKYIDMEPRVIPKTPLRGGVAEFTLKSFDGEVLEGRVLLGATQDAFVIDGRLMEYIYVELKELRTCGKADRLPHYDFDIMYPPLRPEDIVTIPQGFWYGRNMYFRLFDKRRSPFLPDCFEANIKVWVLDGRLAATLPIRVTRTDKPSAPPKTPSDTPPKIDTPPELDK